MKEAVIVSGVRTAIGKLGGSLKDVSEEDLGALVVKEAIKRAGINPGIIDEVVMSTQHRTGDVPFNAARVWAIKAGIPIEVPNYTVNKHCGSGLKTIILAAQSIKLGDADIVVAGGAGSMSRAGYLLKGGRWGFQRLGHQQLIDQLVLLDQISGYTMGETGENVANRFNITREEQDRFAALSQQKAEKAIKSGKFKDEIVPVEIPQPKGEPKIFDTDEHPRFGTTVEALSKLRPVFMEGGTITAGNASGMNDAAAALVVMSEEKAKDLGIEPFVRLVSYASAGVDPAIMGIGPVPATRKALEKAGLTIDDIDLIELNEAFASQAYYCIKELGMDMDKVNLNGSGISLGHPIAVTGAILMVKMIYEMKRRDAGYGLVTMCIGGGQGIAAIVERAWR